MAVVLAPEFPDIDVSRLLKICIIHDLGEAIGGDIPAPEQARRAQSGDAAGKSAAERRDLVTLVAPLPPRQKDEIVALWDEYESAQSAEAKLAKALDKLETLLQHTQGDNPPEFDYRFNLDYARQHTASPPLIAALRAELDKATEARAADASRGNLTIRRGVPTDADALAEIAARLFVQTFGPDNTADDMQAHLTAAYGHNKQHRELTDPAMHTLLVHRHDQLIAFAQLRRGATPSCVTAAAPVEVYRFYVDPSAHGQGVAQTLMTAVRYVAREWHAQHLWLAVWERNPRAIAFYQKEGYRDVGAVDFHIGADIQSDRVMVAPVR